MSERILREFIRHLIESEKKKSKDKDIPDDLLLEPDEDRKDGTKRKKEGSGAAAIGGGPAMPLGAGPSYPGPEPRSRSKARRDVTRVVGGAFGGALPVKKI